MSEQLTIEYWADYICPWCYLALDRVDHLISAHRAEVIWRPFELHPEIPTEGDIAPRLRHSDDVAGYLKDELAEAGLEIRPRATWSNSARALALSAWAQPLPQWPELHRALYRAYWVDRIDLGSPGELLRIATEAGIDRGGAADALAEGWGHDAARAQQERALDLGIGATPGWHFGNGVVLSGAHPRHVFDRVISRIGSD